MGLGSDSIDEPRAGSAAVGDDPAGAPAEPVDDLRPLVHRIATAVERRLARSGRRHVVRVVLTRNRSRMVSWVADGPAVTLRLHELLASRATDDDVDALAAFVAREPDARGRVRAFLDRHAAAVAKVSPPSVRRTRARIRTAGRFHDLRPILQELLADHFPDLRGILITWSARSRRPRRHIRLGSWSQRARLIRIHPRLDSPDVPRFVVASVVHHELCHAALGTSEEGEGQRRVHGREFRALERTYPRLAEAEEWERRHRGLLLSDY